jgi:hypothetical protein
MLNIKAENTLSFNKASYNAVMHDMSRSMQNFERSKASGIANAKLFDIFEEKDLRKDK